MGDYTQANRLISVHTPLGDDVLLLERFRGQEGVSRLFSFDLEMHSENRQIAFDSIVGKPATIRVTLADGSVRYINGIISSFWQGGTSFQGLFQYHAQLVPWFWLLTRTSDCRIFQQMTAPEIIEKLFQEHGFKDFSLRLNGSFRKREYCVQYRETTFNFISRLMEEEGIFYFFEHAQDKHTLVLANVPDKFQPCPNQTKARYESIGGVGAQEDVVTDWSAGQEVRPGKYTVTDFNFETPLLDLTAQVTGKDSRGYEIYDFPGEYAKKDEGESLVGVRMQEEESPLMVVTGSGTCRAFTSGYRFELKEHYRRDFNKAYTLISIRHSCEQGMEFRSGADPSADFRYTNHFQCIPHTVPYRPPRTAPVPVVEGTQTAIVVGPSGEEIYTDKYGRVKVQFHWDREGKYNENSSCWVRVSQNWAGKRWGAMFIPRIGQEVIVDFVEGDPDRPIITGRVYNAASMPPYALPTHMTMSTIKSYSSKGGGGFNEWRFEDKKGKEQIFIHAERNKDIRIKNDLFEWVGNDSHRIIKKSHYEHIEGHQHFIIDKDDLEHVKGDRDTKVDGNRVEEVVGNRHLKVTGNKVELVSSNKSVKVSGDLKEEVTKKVSLKAEDLHQKTKTSVAIDSGQTIHIKAGMTCVIEAGMQLSLKVGGNFIDISPAGVTITGTMVLINSGGAAGSGAGCDPKAPEAPEAPDKPEKALVADNAEPGQAVEMPPPKRPRPVTTYSPAAIVMKDAAANGTPFCDI